MQTVAHTLAWERLLPRNESRLPLLLPSRLRWSPKELDKRRLRVPSDGRLCLGGWPPPVEALADLQRGIRPQLRGSQTEVEKTWRGISNVAGRVLGNTVRLWRILWHRGAINDHTSQRTKRQEEATMQCSRHGPNRLQSSSDNLKNKGRDACRASSEECQRTRTRHGCVWTPTKRGCKLTAVATTLVQEHNADKLQAINHPFAIHNVEHTQTQHTSL